MAARTRDLVVLTAVLACLAGLSSSRPLPKPAPMDRIVFPASALLGDAKEVTWRVPAGQHHVSVVLPVVPYDAARLGLQKLSVYGSDVDVAVSLCLEAQCQARKLRCVDVPTGVSATPRVTLEVDDFTNCPFEPNVVTASINVTAISDSLVSLRLDLDSEFLHSPGFHPGVLPGTATPRRYLTYHSTLLYNKGDSVMETVHRRVVMAAGANSFRSSLVNATTMAGDQDAAAEVAPGVPLHIWRAGPLGYWMHGETCMQTRDLASVAAEHRDVLMAPSVADAAKYIGYHKEVVPGEVRASAGRCHIYNEVIATQPKTTRRSCWNHGLLWSAETLVDNKRISAVVNSNFAALGPHEEAALLLPGACVYSCQTEGQLMCGVAPFGGCNITTGECVCSTAAVTGAACTERTSCPAGCGAAPGQHCTCPVLQLASSEPVTCTAPYALPGSDCSLVVCEDDCAAYRRCSVDKHGNSHCNACIPGHTGNLCQNSMCGTHSECPLNHVCNDERQCQCAPLFSGKDCQFIEARHVVRLPGDGNSTVVRGVVSYAEPVSHFVIPVPEDIYTLTLRSLMPTTDLMIGHRRDGYLVTLSDMQTQGDGQQVYASTVSEVERDELVYMAVAWAGAADSAAGFAIEITSIPCSSFSDRLDATSITPSFCSSGKLDWRLLAVGAAALVLMLACALQTQSHGCIDQDRHHMVEEEEEENDPLLSSADP